MGQKVVSIALHVCEISHSHLRHKMGLLGVLLVDQGEQKNTRKVPGLKLGVPIDAIAQTGRMTIRSTTATQQRNDSCDRHVKTRSTSLNLGWSIYRLYFLHRYSTNR